MSAHADGDTMNPDTSVIGADIVVRGLVSGDGVVVVYGAIEGRIEVDELHVAEGGTVSADVMARVVRVAGIARGTIQASERLDVLATGRVIGAAHAPEVSLIEGAQWHGGTDATAAMAAMAAPAGRDRAAWSLDPRDPLSARPGAAAASAAGGGASRAGTLGARAVAGRPVVARGDEGREEASAGDETAPLADDAAPVAWGLPRKARRTPIVFKRT